MHGYERHYGAAGDEQQMINLLRVSLRTIVKAMHSTGIWRLIFISSRGIYQEVPGENYGSVLDQYRNSAAVIEASGLDYTILRSAWLNDETKSITVRRKKARCSGTQRKLYHARVLRILSSDWQ